MPFVILIVVIVVVIAPVIVFGLWFGKRTRDMSVKKDKKDR